MKHPQYHEGKDPDKEEGKRIRKSRSTIICEEPNLHTSTVLASTTPDHMKYIQSCKTVVGMDYTRSLRPDCRMVQLVWNRKAEPDPNKQHKTYKDPPIPKVQYSVVANVLGEHGTVLFNETMDAAISDGAVMPTQKVEERDIDVPFSIAEYSIALHNLKLGRAP